LQLKKLTVRDGIKPICYLIVIVCELLLISKTISGGLAIEIDNSNGAHHIGESFRHAICLLKKQQMCELV